MMRALFIALLLALPVAAQPVDAARLAAARELVTGMSLQAQLQATLQAMRSQLATGLRQRSPALSEAQVLTIIDEFILPEVAGRTEEVIDNAVTLYATHLTVTELNELAAFQRTPAGQRVAQVLPALTAQLVQFSQGWGQRVVQDAINKHREALRARGVNL